MSTPDLEHILSPLLWAVVGAVAARHYMPERTTRDLDIAILRGNAKEVRQRLQHAGYAHVGELSIGGSTWRAPEGLDVDVIELRADWGREALRAAQSNRDPHGQPIMPLHYLVLMKFEAGRMTDLADIARMVGQADSQQLASLRELFADYSADAVDDLESLIYLGRLEMSGGRQEITDHERMGAGAAE